MTAPRPDPRAPADPGRALAEALRAQARVSAADGDAAGPRRAGRGSEGALRNQIVLALVVALLAGVALGVALGLVSLLLPGVLPAVG